MTDELQLIALLEWLGWGGVKSRPSSSLRGQLYGLHPEYGRSSCPRFTLDLMHEAWLKLPKDMQDTYTYNLKEAVGKRISGSLEWSPNKLANATKEKRLEALLKTIGKWVG